MKYPTAKAVGRFEPELFDPEKWTSNYPNPAFLSRQPDDEYWAAHSINRQYRNIVTPALNVGGWFDVFLGGTLENFVRTTGKGTTQQHLGVLRPAILCTLAEVDSCLLRVNPHRIGMIRNQIRLTSQPWDPETVVSISG